jgi:hypothetical protein
MPVPDPRNFFNLLILLQKQYWLNFVQCFNGLEIQNNYNLVFIIEKSNCNFETMEKHIYFTCLD